MLNNIEFDLWADGYDKTVGISDEENTYPFAGYKKVLGFIFQAIMRAENAAVLDIGFGTVVVKKSRHEKYLFLVYFFKSRHEEHFCGSCFFKSGHGQ